MPLTFREAVRVLWKSRWLTLELIIASCLLAILYTHLQTPKYTATAVLAQQQSNQDNILNSSSALRALSSFSGVDQEAERDMDELLKTASTPSLARKLETKDVMSRVYNAHWDAKQRGWVPQPTIFGLLRQIVRSAIGSHQRSSVNEFDLASYISNNLISINDRTTNFISVSYANKDPAFAVSFLRKIMQSADDQMRTATRQRAASNISFIAKQLATTQQAELKESLIAVLQMQEQRYVLAGSGETYAFRYIQPPIVSDVPTWPAPLRIFLAAIFLAILISASLSFTLYFVDVRVGGFWDRMREQRSFVRAFQHA